MKAPKPPRSRETDPPVLLIVSAEAILVDEEVERIVDRVVPLASRDMNFRTVHGWEAEAEDVVGYLQSMPFLAERRLLVLRQVEQYEGWKDLLPYLKDPNPASVLVMTCADPKGKDTKGKDAKAKESRIKGLAAEVAPKELKRPGQGQMTRWVTDRFSRLGKTVPPNLVGALVDAVGMDLTALAGEVEKVALHAGDRKEIRTEDLAVTMPGNVETLWTFLDAVAEGRAEAALADLRSLRQAGAEPEQVIYHLSRHFRRLVRGRSLVDGGAKPADAARKLGVQDFLKERFARQMGRASREKLAGRIRTLARYDRKLKTQRQSEEVLLDSLVLELLA